MQQAQHKNRYTKFRPSVSPHALMSLVFEKLRPTGQSKQSRRCTSVLLARLLPNKAFRYMPVKQ